MNAVGQGCSGLFMGKTQSPPAPKAPEFRPRATNNIAVNSWSPITMVAWEDRRCSFSGRHSRNHPGRIRMEQLYRIAKQIAAST